MTPAELRTRARELISGERACFEARVVAYADAVTAAALALEVGSTSDVWSTLTRACDAEFALAGDCDHVAGLEHQEQQIPDCYEPEHKLCCQDPTAPREDEYCRDHCRLFKPRE